MNQSAPPEIWSNPLTWITAGLLAGALLTVLIQNIIAPGSGSPEGQQLQETAGTTQHLPTATDTTAQADDSGNPTDTTRAVQPYSAGNVAASGVGSSVGQDSTRTIFLQPGQTYIETRNGRGYVDTYDRAVDNGQSLPVGSGQPHVTDQYGQTVQMVARPPGRNGLQGNPAVDPPSTHGAAYGSSY